MSESRPLDTRTPTSLWKRLRVLPFLAAVCLVLSISAGLGLHLYGETAPSSLYRSEADVMLVRRLAPEKPVDAGEDVLATQMIVIQSQLVVDLAARSLGNLKTFQGKADPTMVIRDGLNAKRKAPGAPVFTLTFDGPVAEDCPKIVDAVVLAYRKYLLESHKESTTVRVDQLRSLETRLAERRRIKWLTLKDLTDASGNDPTNLALKQRIAMELFTQVKSRFISLRVRRPELEQQIQLLEKAAREQPRSLAISLEAARWASQSGYDKLPAEVRKDTDPLQAYILSLKEELEKNGKLVAELGKELEILDADSRSMTKRFDLESVKIEIEISQQWLKEVSERANELDQNSDQAEFEIRVLNPPQVGRR